jgi:nucleotide-binding universal stress UspA family protein
MASLHRQTNDKEESGISNTILLATDGSLPALAATVRATDMARDKKAKLVVLSVKEQTPITSMEKMAGDSALARVPGVDGLDYARKMAGMRNVSAEYITKDGPVVGEIIHMATKVGAETIVIGSSDPRGISGFLLGNVAESVVKLSPCTVLVIKPTPDELKATMEMINGFRETVRTIDISDITGSKRFKLGLVLFAIYLCGYASFTLAGSFDRSLFRQSLLGLNVALVTGMTLIFVAIAIAIGYNWYVDRRETNKGGA